MNRHLFWVSLDKAVCQMNVTWFYWWSIFLIWAAYFQLSACSSLCCEKLVLLLTLTWGVEGRVRSAMLLRSANSLASWKTTETTRVKGHLTEDGLCQIIQFVRIWTKHWIWWGFNTMALFSLMFLSRFLRLWDRTLSLSSSTSSSSSSSSSSPSCCCCCCFVLCLLLALCEGRVSLTGFLIIFSCGSFLGVESLLTGNLRSNNKLRLLSNHWRIPKSSQQ